MDRLETYIEFWGNYVPEIQGIARAIRIASETENAARAALDDMIGAVHDACRDIIGRLHNDGKLADGWSVDEAADLLWSMLSIGNWESLTVDRGWTVDQYVKRMQTLSRRAFVRDAE